MSESDALPVEPETLRSKVYGWISTIGLWMIPVGVLLATVARIFISGDTIMVVGSVIFGAGFVLMFTGMFASLAASSKSTKKMLDTFDAEQRQARGTADMFRDFHVRAVWSDWNEQLERGLASASAGKVDFNAENDYGGWLLDARQETLTEFANLAADNPDVTLAQVLERMEEFVTHVKEAYSNLDPEYRNENMITAWDTVLEQLRERARGVGV